VAAENGVAVVKSINNINKQLYPNRFSPQAMEFKTLSGRMINGKFTPEQLNSNWYLLKTNQPDKAGNIFAYARTSHERNLLTIWYQRAAKDSDSGWYASFSYRGQMVGIDSIWADFIELNLSDTKVVNELFSSRMIGRITFRDVLILSRSELVKVRYKLQTKKNTFTYTMALNDAKTFTDENKTQTSKRVLTQLINAARNLDKNCCVAPSIDPLSDRYGSLYMLCREKTMDYLIKNKSIRQDCHMILKNSKDSYQLILAPLNFNLERLLYDIDMAMKI